MHKQALFSFGGEIAQESAIDIGSATEQDADETEYSSLDSIG